MPGWIPSSFSANSDQTFFCTSSSCSRAERLDESHQFAVCTQESHSQSRDLLSNGAIVQELPMGILSSLGGINSRPTAYLGRASKDGPDDLEDEELETRPFAHDFGDDPAGVGVVDDDFAFLGSGCADALGHFLDGVHFEELGEIISGVVS